MFGDELETSRAYLAQSTIVHRAAYRAKPQSSENPRLAVLDQKPAFANHRPRTCCAFSGRGACIFGRRRGKAVKQNSWLRTC